MFLHSEECQVFVRLMSFYYYEGGQTRPPSSFSCNALQFPPSPGLGTQATANMARKYPLRAKGPAKSA